MSNLNILKNRHLPLYEYLEKLQLEYISYEVRSKVYPIEQHRSYWRLAMEKKKQRIEEISLRNKLPNIFNDNYIESTSREKFYEFKTPNFQYRNEEFRTKWEYWDRYNYYFAGSEVRVDLDPEIVVGKIVDFVPKNNFLYVNIEGASQKVLLTQVTRIL